MDENTGTETENKGTENQGQITPELVKDYLNTEEGKKLIQPIIDASNTKAIKTYSEKTLPKLLEEEIAKRNPTETPEQKELRQIRAEIEKTKVEAKKEKLLNLAMKKVAELGLPAEYIETQLGEDEESTLANIEKYSNWLTGLLTKKETEAATKILKDNGRTVTSDAEKKGMLTVADTANMTREELIRNQHRIKQ